MTADVLNWNHSIPYLVRREDERTWERGKYESKGLTVFCETKRHKRICTSRNKHFEAVTICNFSVDSLKTTSIFKNELRRPRDFHYLTAPPLTIFLGRYLRIKRSNAHFQSISFKKNVFFLNYFSLFWLNLVKCFFIKGTLDSRS